MESVFQIKLCCSPTNTSAHMFLHACLRCCFYKRTSTHMHARTRVRIHGYMHAHTHIVFFSKFC